MGGGDELNFDTYGPRPWARDIICLSRFKQILKAFRSRKSAPVKVKDKAYQLRTLCETLNKGAKRTFKLGRFVKEVLLPDRD